MSNTEEILKKIAEAQLPNWITQILRNDIKRLYKISAPPVIVIQEIETILEVWQSNTPQCKQVGQWIHKSAERKAANMLRQMFPQTI